MGVPKFFRYVSERYPCLSELVRNYQIPEFDNLYLDMNGIIHMCSHPDDGDAHFRITEEQIFKDIFHYIEVLFRMIKPQKLFFMAVDGVAPRAKMNQQRGRRFNSAKAAEKLELEAQKKGEVLPTEARFDNNCITPGTEFMVRLHEQLKYFVVHKISSDEMWRKCRVILSGHETPGEGEHKIMDYIRYMRAQPGYDPNTRHCLYGLDADLIMLGLCTHEPHFSLLREEVKFGKKSTKRKSVPEEITFYLLHLSLMRDYLELEFSKVKGKLPFAFDIESIIDDWVLMGFLVGNDFIPHLPNLHITKGALPLLYSTYMKILPTLEGYINEKGTLNLDRFEKFMQCLAAVDMDNFTEHFADLKFFEAKTGRRPNENERTVYKSEGNPDDLNLITFDSPAKKVVEPSEENLKALAVDTFEDVDPETTGEVESGDSSLSQSDDDELMYKEFSLHKKDYYMNKLEYAQVTPEVLRDQAEGYVKAIQWNLHYYYNGCPSWSWYYPHHYAPYISDIKGFGELKIEFELGKPFLPFEQLLAVLPSASKSLLPQCYQHLMTDESSPIKQYYPLDFKKDLNGKKQDWEAVVLVPFIDEKLLLKAMKTFNGHLTPEEAARNTHRPMLVYSYSKKPLPRYKSPGYFSDVLTNHADCLLLSAAEIAVPVDELVKGAYPGAKMDVYYTGFPTFKHLSYEGALEMAKVKVFEQPSRSESMIISVAPYKADEDLATTLLGTTVYVGWPHLTEALVIAISNETYRYHHVQGPGQYDLEDNKGNLKTMWHMEVRGISDHYLNRFGINVGETSILVHVKVLVGRKYACTTAGLVELEKQWSDLSQCFPMQTVVRNITVYDDSSPPLRTIMDVFPVGCKCFMLGHPHYGAMGEVLDSTDSLPRGRLKVSMTSAEEPHLFDVKELEREVNMCYMPLFAATSQLAISKPVFSKITGTVYMISRNPASDSTMKVNVGLNLKFNMKNLETPGYTRKIDNNWLYSEKTVQLVRQYLEFCPKLFEYLTFNQTNEVIKEDIFPEETEQNVKKIKEFLKSLPCSSVERQKSGTTTLDLEIVTKIENIVDEYAKTQSLVKNAVMYVKPHLLYKADVVIGEVAPDIQASYQLCDRVVNVKEGYTVPLGLKGTVIGIYKVGDDEIYDVVFDRPFPGGLQLNCSPGRGYKLTKSSMINLSYGARLYQYRTGVKGPVKMSLEKDYLEIGNGYKPGNLYAKMFPMQNSAFAALQKPPVVQQRQESSPLSASGTATSLATTASSMSNFEMEVVELPLELVRPKDMSDRSVQTGLNKRQRTSFSGMQPYDLPHGMQTTELKESNVTKFMDQVKQKPLSSPEGSRTVLAGGGVKMPVKVDTDALKKLLQINDASNSSIANIKEKKIGTTISAEDFFARTKEQQEKSSPNAKIHSCMQLMSYYEAQRLGVPQYQYFPMPNGMHQAQIKLPSGQIILGDTSKDKEQASESAAQKALRILTPFIREIPTKKMPYPPDNWYRTNSNPPEMTQLTSKMMRVDSRIKTDDDSGSWRSHGSQRTSSKPNSSPFIPLQAVRQQVTSKNANKNRTKEADHKSDGSSNKSSRSQNARQDEVSKDEKNQGTEKRRQRKMRLAANFGKVAHT